MNKNEIIQKYAESLNEMDNKDKTLWENEWLSIKQKDGWYTYMHQEKSDGKAIAVLGYSEDPFMVLGRYENTPCHGDGIALSSLTGMVDPGEDFLDAAVREFGEESGLDANKEDFIELGEVRPSKASDTIIKLYAVKIDYVEGKTSGEGDGTQGEEGAYCKMVSSKEAIDSKDPMLCTAILRLLVKKEGML